MSSTKIEARKRLSRGSSEVQNCAIAADVRHAVGSATSQKSQSHWVEDAKYRIRALVEIAAEAFVVESFYRELHANRIPRAHRTVPLTARISELIRGFRFKSAPNCPANVPTTQNHSVAKTQSVAPKTAI
jgi:hypothetical protein